MNNFIWIDKEIVGLKEGDILTNENGVTCIYGIMNELPELIDIDKAGRVTGDHIEEYIHRHNLKVTDHMDNYPVDF